MRALSFFAALLAAASLGAQEVELSRQLNQGSLPPIVQQKLMARTDPFEFRSGWIRRTISGEVVQGSFPLVVIPVLFADSETPQEMVSTTALQTRLFASSSPSTVTAYFRELSLGKLNISGVVTGWTPTSFLRAEVVGQSFGLGPEAKPREWLREAVANADASIDFGQFDNDGPDGVPNSGDDDGRVDGAAFLFYEIEGSCGGPGVWPHRWTLAQDGIPGAVTNDPGANGGTIIVADYMTLGARSCVGNQPLGVNVFAHETGHVLGLPDYYDLTDGVLRQQRRWVVGCWEIMSAGSWGCGSGPGPAVIQPPHMGPHPKMIMGWITPKVVEPSLRPVQYELRPAHSSGDALQVRLADNEYLLVEYRLREGFDAALPASGVLVYHVESGRPFLPCNGCPRTYSYALLEADGDSALVRQETAGGNRGAAGDAFGVTRNRIDDATIPSTRLNGGASTWVRITGIAVDAAAKIARVTISLLPSRLTINALVSALGGTPLTSGDDVLLDQGGNGNGRFDVGDFRAYLRYLEQTG
jgi:M6 family metalloprotease-like protein